MKRFEERIRAAIASAMGVAPEKLAIESPKNRELGDFAFPCFALAKEKKQAPPLLAEELAKKIMTPGVISRATGPYVNFTIERRELAKALLPAILSNRDRYGFENEGAGRTIVIDYSSPNIAKPFGVGHLRSTVIGAALKRILEFRGFSCVGIDHLGDWGMQFGRMMLAVKRYDPQESYAQAADPTKALLDLYVRIHQEEENTPALKDEARAWFLKLESGKDAEAKRLWKSLIDSSWKEFERIYKMLGVSFEQVQGESFYEDKLAGAIARIEKSGVTQISEGALIVDLEAEKLPPCLLRTGEGTTLYATRDLAAAFYRYETWKFHKALYVVGSDQRLHFRQLRAVLKKMSLPWAEDVIHIDFGMMNLKEGKMSTRKGRVIFLEEVLDRSIEMVRKVIEEKNPDLKDREAVAKSVGIGAVIFNDLKNNRVKDVLFDWEQVLNFDGETGPYVQYTHARLCSILRKSGKTPDPAKLDYSRFDEAGTLLALLGRFPKALADAAASYEPSMLTSYILDVAQTANHFYKEHRVIGEPAEIEMARLAVVDAARTVIANGLRLLGITAPEEM